MAVYSILIPSYNEAESLTQLESEIRSALSAQSLDYEIIIIDDGSTDHTKQVTTSLLANNINLKYLALSRNFGKAAALHAGIVHSTGNYIITLDADLQDDPTEIPRIITKMNEGLDLVVGWKQTRHDPCTKTLPSKLFNYFTNQLAKTQLHDHNSGLKIMSRAVAQQLPLYGDLHRYIPAIAAINGYKVGEIAVNHRPRKFGKSKYGLKRVFHGFFDIITVFLISRYASKPMHLFGYVGFSIFSIGFLIGIYLTYERIILNAKIGDRPLLNLAMLCMILGVQVGITGIIGELINYNKRDPSRYYTIKSITDEKNSQHLSNTL